MKTNPIENSTQSHTRLSVHFIMLSYRSVATALQFVYFHNDKFVKRHKTTESNIYEFLN